MTEASDRALQVAVRDALLADPDVATLFGAPARVHDDAPSDAIFPYVAFGRASIEPADGDLARLDAHVIHLHVWSRHGGKAEAKAGLGLLRAALHNADLALDDHRLVSLRVTYTDVFRSGDGRTTQGLLRLRALTEPLQ